MAQPGSLARTLRKACSPALNQNEWTMATPLARSACTSGEHEFEKFTLPTWWPWPPWPACSSSQSAAVVKSSEATVAIIVRRIMTTPKRSPEQVQGTIAVTRQSVKGQNRPQGPRMRPMAHYNIAFHTVVSPRTLL
jgi:hypothetical protein